MEPTEGKLSVLLTAKDFEEKNLAATAKTIAYNSGHFYVVAPELAQKKRLSMLIEQLSDGLKDSEKTMSGKKLCYEIRFTPKMPVFYWLDGGEETQARCLSDILDALELREDGRLAKRCHIIVEDEGRIQSKAREAEAKKEREQQANRLVAEIFQQAVFLGLVDLDVKKRSENRLYQQKKRFRKEYEHLKAGVQAFGQALAAAGSPQSEEGRKRMEGLYAAAKGLDDALKQADERPLKIAVMGTKKAGKSVVVNCLLGAEYAPTSLELPTPNRIDYVPWKKKNILLQYKKRDMIFDSVREIHDYIEQEFKKAQQETGEKAGLEDMLIRYPQRGMDSCIIMDTPGPNYAGAGEEHARIAEECIKEADICIFVMNYANYLSDDEDKFLKKIHQYFEEQGKFYSFFVAINRIDERYNDAHSEKSTTRVIDYIRGKMEGLGYKGVLAFGTSALSYYYMKDVRELARKDEKAGPLKYDDIRELRKKYKDERSKCTFISSAYDCLEDDGIEEPTDAAIDAMSGIPQLISHTFYVGQQKADTELVNHAIGLIDAKYTIIRNGLMLEQLLELKNLDTKKKHKIQKAINDFQASFDRVKRRLEKFCENEENYTRQGRIEKFKERLDDNKRQGLKNLEDDMRERVEDADWTAADFKGSRDTEKWHTFQKDIEGLAESFTKGMKQLGKDIGVETAGQMQADFSYEIFDAQQDIRRQVETFQDAVRQESSEAADALSKYQLPKVEMNFEIPADHVFEVNAGSLDLDAIYQGSLKTYVKSEKRGFWGNLIHPVDWLFDLEGSEFSQEACEQQMMKYCERKLVPQIEEECQKTVEAVASGIDACFQSFYAGTTEFKENYDTNLTNMQHDLQLAFEGAAVHEAALQQDLVTFHQLADTFGREFAETWDSVRNAGEQNSDRDGKKG